MDELKPLEPKVVTHGVATIEINPNSKYIVFIDRKQIDQDAFCQDAYLPIPAGTPVWAVDDINTAIKIYELLDTRLVYGTDDSIHKNNDAQ